MAQFATLAEVQDAVKAGRKVNWCNENYVAMVDLFGAWHIAYRPWSNKPNFVGMFWADGISSEYKPEEFYIADEVTA